MKWTTESREKFQKMFENTKVQQLTDRLPYELNVENVHRFMHECICLISRGLGGYSGGPYACGAHIPTTNYMTEEESIWAMADFVKMIVDENVERRNSCIAAHNQFIKIDTEARRLLKEEAEKEAQEKFMSQVHKRMNELRGHREVNVCL